MQNRDSNNPEKFLLKIIRKTTLASAIVSWWRRVLCKFGYYDRGWSKSDIVPVALSLFPSVILLLLIPLEVLGIYTVKFFRLFWPSRSLIRRKINTAPGTNLLFLVDFFFSPRIVELTFKPILADWHAAYFEALNQGRIWKARWISVRYRYAFIKAMGLSKVYSLLKQIMSLSK